MEATTPAPTATAGNSAVAVGTEPSEPVISEASDAATTAGTSSTAGAAAEATNEVPATPMEVVLIINLIFEC